MGFQKLERALHLEGVARVLKARSYYDQTDDFERSIILTLRGSLVRYSRFPFSSF